jgi:YHS domain-containing protein
MLPMLCGRTVTGDARYFPQAEYRGRTLYFCTEFCRNAFLSDPDRFAAAHSKQYKQGPPEAERTTT